MNIFTNGTTYKDSTVERYADVLRRHLKLFDDLEIININKYLDNLRETCDDESIISAAEDKRVKETLIRRNLLLTQMRIHYNRFASSMVWAPDSPTNFCIYGKTHDKYPIAEDIEKAAKISKTKAVIYQDDENPEVPVWVIRVTLDQDDERPYGTKTFYMDRESNGSTNYKSTESTVGRIEKMEGVGAFMRKGSNGPKVPVYLVNLYLNSDDINPYQTFYLDRDISDT